MQDRSATLPVVSPLNFFPSLFLFKPPLVLPQILFLSRSSRSKRVRRGVGSTHSVRYETSSTITSQCSSLAKMPMSSAKVCQIRRSPEKMRAVARASAEETTDRQTREALSEPRRDAAPRRQRQCLWIGERCRGMIFASELSELDKYEALEFSPSRLVSLDAYLLPDPCGVELVRGARSNVVRELDHGRSCHSQARYRQGASACCRGHGRAPNIEHSPRNPSTRRGFRGKLVGRTHPT